MKHTKEPWILTEAKENASIHSDNGGTIAHIPDINSNWQANARLIAASPDLLLAAKDAKLRLEAIGATTIGLTQAIAKAEGGDNA